MELPSRTAIDANDIDIFEVADFECFGCLSFYGLDDIGDGPLRDDGLAEVDAVSISHGLNVET